MTKPLEDGVRKRKRNPLPRPVDGKKGCPCCQQVLPTEAFAISKRSTSGLQSWCRGCEQAAKDAYEAANPGAKKERFSVWYTGNRDRILERERRNLRAQRIEALDALGGRCACCGENRFEFLAIDHIHNDGKADRALKGSGRTFHRRLKEDGYPRDRYRVLCHNCNLARAFYGCCPHEAERELACG